MTFPKLLPEARARIREAASSCEREMGLQERLSKRDLEKLDIARDFLRLLDALDAQDATMAELRDALHETTHRMVNLGKPGAEKCASLRAEREELREALRFVYTRCGFRSDSIEALLSKTEP